MPSRARCELFIVLILTTVLGSTGCESRKAHLERGVNYAERLFKKAHKDPMAKLSFNSVAEMGGTLTAFITANLPPDSDLPRFYDESTDKAWSIVLRQNHESGTIIVEGYGEDLSKPLIEREIDLPPPLD